MSLFIHTSAVSISSFFNPVTYLFVHIVTYVPCPIKLIKINVPKQLQHYFNRDLLVPHLQRTINIQENNKKSGSLGI